MKIAKKKKTIQSIARKKIYSTVQPWIIYFTERYADQQEKDFFTFVKAKSANMARTILVDKLKDDDSTVIVKSLQVFLLHKNYRNRKTGQTLDIENWGKIHEASFPNVPNFLYKQEVPRPDGFNTRFNRTDYEHMKTIGFKKGKDNWSYKNRKGKHLPLNKRIGKKWTGDKWVDIDPKEMSRIEAKLVSAFIATDNNRSRVAQYLNISRHKLYKLMKTVHPLDWWEEHYPPPVVGCCFSYRKKS